MNHHELLAAIHDVFDGVRLDGGTTLREAHAESYSPGNRNASEAARAVEVPEHWGAVLDEELDEFGNDLVFLDWRGFRFYLPALMGWSLRGHRDHPGWVKDDTLHFVLGRYGPKRSHVMCQFLDRMSDAERRIVACFLAHLVIEHRDRNARDCLNVGWRAFVDRGR